MSELATLGAGCFWCVEAVFKKLRGIDKVVSGYAGGHFEYPTYQDVCTGTTGHAEVVQLTFEPDVITFEDILCVFWKTHDPTTLNRQGHDIGTAYRSAIFYHNDTQKNLAIVSRKITETSGLWANPIVTEITKFTNFYPAESYHQNYYALNFQQPYCLAVIEPKMKKLKNEFADKLKP